MTRPCAPCRRDPHGRVGKSNPGRSRKCGFAGIVARSRQADQGQQSRRGSLHTLCTFGAHVGADHALHSVDLQGERDGRVAYGSEYSQMSATTKCRSGTALNASASAHSRGVDAPVSAQPTERGVFQIAISMTYVFIVSSRPARHFRWVLAPRLPAPAPSIHGPRRALKCRASRKGRSTPTYATTLLRGPICDVSAE